MTDAPQRKRWLHRRLRRALLSIVALMLLIGAATYLWTQSLLNKASQIDIGHSREDVQTILGNPVATGTANRLSGDGGPPVEYVTEFYDPVFGFKARIDMLCEPLGWVPFDLDQTEWPVRLHFDGNDCVDMIQRGDEIIRK